MDKIQHGDAIMGTYEDIYGVKTTIEIKDILKSCKTENKQVLVFGRAGIGKSTFCRYIAYQWARGSFLSEYELVALIPLRHLTIHRYPDNRTYSLMDLVKREVFSLELGETESDTFKKLFYAKKTLWILDGYDEIVQSIPETLEYLLEQLLKTPHHILTSRPYLNTLSYKVTMEITGFTDKNIEQYIDQFFSPTEHQPENEIIKKTKLLEFLKSKRSICGIAHIPVNLELICSVWSNRNLSETQNLTMTTLYREITDWLCRRYLILQSPKIQTLSEKKLYEYCHKEVTFLETLAFHAMKDNTIIIQPRLLNKIIEENQIDSEEDYPKVLKIGLLKSFHKQKIGTQVELKKDHYFIHLSFQEYFAARYLVRMLNEQSINEAKEFINRQKYNQRYTLVFNFMSGLISETHSLPTRQMFWNIILGEPLDMVGIRHMQLIISCMEAASDITTVPNHYKLLNWISDCIHHYILQPSEIISNHILQHLKTAESVTNHEIILNILIPLLQHSEPNIQTQTLHVLGHLSISNQLDKITSLIADSFSHQDKNVRRSACEVLRSMGEKAATNEVISKLASALGDQDEWNRMSVCQALGNMGEKAATNEVIKKLVSALGDQTYSVRMSACAALGNMGEKAATNEVIEKVVSALGDQSEWVRRSACKALGKMGEKEATNEVINKLVSALGDQSELVRMSAWEALGNMGEKAATNEVIKKLVSALGDQTYSVRMSACEALGKMGEKAATNEVIEKVVSLLGNHNAWVRMSACEARGNMGEKAATKVVIEKVVSLLGDQNESVRWRACEALGNMGEKAVTNEVINKLVSLLGDQCEWVRRRACEALGKMGEKAATNEVINKLVSLLGDQSDSVRMNAWEALGNMGEKAVTNEVIKKLVSALGDQNGSVRWSASDVLGNMGEKAATNEVIEKVVSLLGDQSGEIRMSACKALGKMGEKAATNEVIEKLVSALGDQIELVTISAFGALGKMGKKAARNEVIKKLVSLLGDQNESVRWHASEVLGNMGEKAATNEVIEKLVSLLGDEGEWVRRRACEALGKMGEKAATNEVINKLVSLLGDQKEWVRWSACKALGKMGEKAATNEVIRTLLRMRIHESEYVIQQLILASLKETSVVERLDPELIIDCYASKIMSDITRRIPFENLMESCLVISDLNRGLIVSRGAVKRGIALIEWGDEIFLYEKNEPISLGNISSETRENVRKIFRTQRAQLHLV